MLGCVPTTVLAKAVVKAYGKTATAKVRLRLQTDLVVRVPAMTCAVPAARNVVVRSLRMATVVNGETGPWMAPAERNLKRSGEDAAKSRLAGAFRRFTG